MNLSDKITELRSQKGWSQSELAKRVEVSREIVGRYERSDAMPSIDVAKRLADAFEVSLDYLEGNAEIQIDKASINRLNEVSKMNSEDKNLVWSFLDAFILKTKLQGVMK
jgi:transcriptional regulator with XRE-family HTH domain